MNTVVLDDDSEIEERYRIAGEINRFYAFFIDLIILLVVIYGSIISIALLELDFVGIDYDEKIDKYIDFMGGDKFIIFTIWILYCIIMDYSKLQGSIGKKFCKLKVVSFEGNKLSLWSSIIRNLSKLISLYVFCLGFIWILINKENKSWHDIISRTKIIRKI